mmetsp:Transcript_74421/g.198896  ORF Transcript_74421/g.198896 Transcript_74421/m.198896 type:complete len:112 (-) Transcript_74421:726-1061(-)
MEVLDGKMYVFGGNNYNNPLSGYIDPTLSLDDLAEFDIASLTWTSLTPTSSSAASSSASSSNASVAPSATSPPTARAYSSLTPVGDHLYLFGGSDGGDRESMVGFAVYLAW